jgi:hypothetical protein
VLLNELSPPHSMHVSSSSYGMYPPPESLTGVVERIVKCLLLFQCPCRGSGAEGRGCEFVGEFVGCSGGESCSETGSCQSGHVGHVPQATTHEHTHEHQSRGEETGGRHVGHVLGQSAPCCAVWRRTLIEIHEARGEACLLTSLSHLRQAAAHELTHEHRYRGGGGLLTSSSHLRQSGGGREGVRDGLVCMCVYVCVCVCLCVCVSNMYVCMYVCM